MSKIGKLPITITNGVTVTLNGNELTITGPKGNFIYKILEGIIVTIADGKVSVTQEQSKKDLTKALFGLTRATIANYIEGVSTGFEKKLELSGVGYRAQTSGTDLTLSVGFSHQVKMQAPNGIKFAVVDNIISILGSDIALVGNTAARIRAVRPPEPYKGKGIKYVGEYIRRKAGKAAKAVGGTAK